LSSSPWWGCPSPNPKGFKTYASQDVLNLVFSLGFYFSRQEQVGGDLNPRPPECKEAFSEQLWTNFGSWLLKTHKQRHAKEVLRYARRFAIILERPNLASQLLVLSKDLRRMAMSSLSNLSKYLGIYEQWKQTIRNHGLKWENTNSLEAFLSILNSNLEETEVWLRQVIQRLPKEYSAILVFDALTGLRPSEAALSCSLITEVSEQNKLELYLDEDLMMLEHFRFPDLFLRKSKNAYISFITSELLNLVLEIKPKIKYAGLDTKIGRLGFNNQTKQLRRLYATTLRNSLPQELVDLLQGRISQTVFMKFYYHPFLQDTRNKVLAAIHPLEKELIGIVRHNQN
jgi:intergrase/recombinase